MLLQLAGVIPGYDARQPSGLAACSATNCLYVSYDAIDKILKCDFSTTGITTCYEWDSPAPSQMSVTGRHNLLVVCDDRRNSTMMIIREYTPTGELLRETPPDGGGQFTLWQAAELDGGERLLVSRLGSSGHGVGAMSWNGAIAECYPAAAAECGEVGADDYGQLDDPRCLAVTSDGYALVADHVAARILVVGPSLADARELPLTTAGRDNIMAPMRYPSAMCYDEERRRLYVGENGGWCRVVVYDNVAGFPALFGGNADKK